MASAPPTTTTKFTTSFQSKRPIVVGPDTPEDPYPIFMSGIVQHGFGRGSKDLGCPTANLPDEALESMTSVTKPGVYYGYAQVRVPPPPPNATIREKDAQVLPMVMSLGWNPFYKNQKLTAEVHIMHNFDHDFYGYEINVLVLGYIRPELDFTTMDALIEEIEMDKRVALNSLQRPNYAKYLDDPRFHFVAEGKL